MQLGPGSRFGMWLCGFGLVTAGLWWGCSEEASTEPPANSTGTATATGTGGHGGNTPTGAGGATTTTPTGTGGTGGAGGTPWPTCETNPGGAVRTIPQIWQEDPTTPTPVWVEGVIITGVTWGNCTGGHSCSIFVQQDPTYADMAAGAHHAIKLYASAATADHLSGLGAGDVVDIYAHAVRSDWGGTNELQLLVNEQYPGCAEDVGDADPQPIPGVALADLTVQVYEQTHGPLFVRVDTVSGTPGPADETFGLWETGQFSDAGIAEVVSLSPYLLQDGVFVGLAQQQTPFSYVQGVFGLFIPPVDGGTVTKYQEIYPRSMADVVP